jgi:peptidoglycan/xylan/chitin deacetylase (PgdA/CDA1 family)
LAKLSLELERGCQEHLASSPPKLKHSLDLAAISTLTQDNLLQFIFTLLRFTLVPLFIREVFQKRKVTIILYHNPGPVTADLHFTLLKSKYKIITLKDFINAKKSGGINKLPPKSLIITLDDGFMGNYELLPIFKKHEIIPTIFLSSSIVGTNRHFWWTESHGRFDNEYLKKLPNVERLKLLKETGFAEDREYDDRQALSKDEILKMKDNVDFQSHSQFHPCLPECTIDQARQEIEGSKKEIMEKFDIDVFALSYPNGNYSVDVIRLAKETEYECGITIDSGFNNQDTDPFRLRRICVRDTGGGNELIVRVSGLWDFLKRIVKSSLSIWSRHP